MLAVWQSGSLAVWRSGSRCAFAQACALLLSTTSRLHGNRLRLGAAAEGSAGPAPGAAARGLLVRAAGGGGGGGGASPDPNYAFDAALGSLLDGAYAKTRGLVDYLHLFAGVDDAVDGGGGDSGGGPSPPGGASGSGRAGQGAPPLTVLTVRQQLAAVAVARDQAERRAAETADAARSVLGASAEKRKLLEKEVANFPPAGRAGARMALYLLPLCAVCAVARLAYLLLPLMSFALQLGWPLSRQSTHPVLTGMHFSS